jgi:DNA repair exonuclease SbcCD nuclease subunit
LKFYNDTFFPTLEKEGITTVIDMGDTFDSRKGVDFSSLAWAKDNYYDRLQRMGCEIHTIVGNHTAYYKNTNDVNAVDLLLREYDNVKIYSEATDIKIDNLNILLIPWINSENEEMTLQAIDKSKSKVAMGHLECKGFRIHRGFVMDQGTDVKTFDKFDRVYSGHYHTRSDDGKIYYLGNPYEMYWNDISDTRGFHIFELKIVENFQLIDNEDFEAFESENTLSILNRYVEESDIDLEKSRIQTMISDVYQEACELV